MFLPQFAALRQRRLNLAVGFNPRVGRTVIIHVASATIESSADGSIVADATEWISPFDRGLKPTAKFIKPLRG